MMKKYHTHKWEVTPKEALRIQADLRTLVFLHNGFKKVTHIAGCDVSFNERKNLAFASCVVLSFPELKIVEETRAIRKVNFTYVPGLLSFREGEVILDALDKLTCEPDIILFDGQGIAHPRGVGLATHVGILLEKSTIGCAKSKLVGKCDEPEEKKGSFTPIYLESKKVGVALRTKEKSQHIFVSPGHLIDLDTSISIVLHCLKGHRIPEPLRLADIKSRELKSSRRTIK